ncbi:DUF2726 domain-containing protein [Ruficoccus sp. ZRK36]|uniref:DUF2726 domain-containing protein n=1 Tax=Ruficoccus sp. ZRK36 TaxID=2866311 RepID=UPI001C7341B7|nr:DUF2726 domain-containing protein [Ruficoccus sp. ZRK36]QYY35163.1 DUF2726 domain-containing protein [Ruficoccus sp. ZRK36]
MLYIIIGLAVIMGVVAVLGELLKKEKGPPKADLAESRHWLLTKHECVLFDLLTQCLPEGMHIHSKVRLADLIRLKKTQDRKAYGSMRARTDRKHVDFVITRGSSEIAFAVELDDSSHQREDRKQRDQFVDSVFSAAGIPLIHVIGDASKMTPEEIRAKLPLMPPKL